MDIKTKAEALDAQETKLKSDHAAAMEIVLENKATRARLGLLAKELQSVARDLQARESACKKMETAAVTQGGGSDGEQVQFTLSTKKE